VSENNILHVSEKWSAEKFVYLVTGITSKKEGGGVAMQKLRMPKFPFRLQLHPIYEKMFSRKNRHFQYCKPHHVTYLFHINNQILILTEQ
jgi:hypothetical protein